MTDDFGSDTHRYRCSSCRGVWEMDELPAACPHCGNDVLGGCKEIQIREVGVESTHHSEVLPEFEQVAEEVDPT